MEESINPTSMTGPVTFKFLAITDFALSVFSDFCIYLARQNHEQGKQNVLEYLYDL